MISVMNKFAESPMIEPCLIVARYKASVDGDFEQDEKQIQ